MTVVKYLVEKGQAVITTQDETPISHAERKGHTNIAHYLKAQVMKMVMEINVLPFYTGVRGIIAKYLQ